MSQIVGLPNNSYKPITNTAWGRTWLCKLQKRCTRLTTASDKVYQLLAHGRWFYLGTPASSTTKTGRHDIAEILLNVALNTINQIKSYEGINGSHTNNLSSVKHETLITPSNYLHIFFHTYFIYLLYVTNSYYPNSFNLSVYYAGCHFYRRVVPFSNNVF